MKAVLQRVISAEVKVDEQTVGSINKGLLVLLGISPNDSFSDIEWLIGKIIQMRIFSDENDLMNLSVTDINGEVLLVSQFTLYASTKKGNRPSFINAAPPEKAKELYEQFVNTLKQRFNGRVATGVFAADMQVRLVNSGPVTIIIDSQNKE